MLNVRDWRTTVFITNTQQITYTTYTIYHKVYTQYNTYNLNNIYKNYTSQKK